MAINNSHTINLTIEVVPPEVVYQVDPAKGRLPKRDDNYVLVEEPTGIPSYAISHLQDYYLTPTPDAFVIPLFLNLRNPFFSEFDQYYVVTEVTRLNLPLLAHFFYQQVEYWWIIALANDITDPFELEAGKILRIPSEEVILNKWLKRPVRRRPTTGDLGFVFS